MAEKQLEGVGWQMLLAELRNLSSHLTALETRIDTQNAVIITLITQLSEWVVESNRLGENHSAERLKILSEKLTAWLDTQITNPVS